MYRQRFVDHIRTIAARRAHGQGVLPFPALSSVMCTPSQFYWQPSMDDLRHILHQMYKDDGLSIEYVRRDAVYA